MADRTRVGIVTRCYGGWGGLQTCIVELIMGLNAVGITPDIIWDEPQDWGALGSPALRSAFAQGRLGISSATLRKLPSWLSNRARLISHYAARLNLERYNYLYCFEPGIRMPLTVPNVCWMTGPAYLRLPHNQVGWNRLSDWREVKKALSNVTWPLVKLDKHSHYVTHSQWIADLFYERCHLRIPVIWPPARSRTLPTQMVDRSGLLFLSRLEAYKRADSMLSLARALPDQRVTLAGAVAPQRRDYVDQLIRRIRSENLSNVVLIENPTEEQVAYLLTSHEVFVFPAEWEHFGIVTVEAVLAGLLPIVHDTGGQREIVPVEALRFTSEEELIDRARRVLEMKGAARRRLLDSLGRHVQRGSPENYRAVMLREVGLS